MRHYEHQLTLPDGSQRFAQAWEVAQPRAVVALVHGLGEHSGRYTNLVPALNEHHISVYALDHLGHGRSPGKRGFVQRWSDLTDGVDALVGWARTQAGNQPLFVYGHSLGGLIALDYTLDHQGGTRGLILSAPGLSSDGLSPVLVTASKILSRVAPGLALATGLPVTGISRDPAVQAAYTNDKLNHAVGTPRLATESFAAVKRVRARGADLRLPLLLIHGAADPIVPLQASTTFFNTVASSDKTLIPYLDVVHEPHNDLGWQQVVADVTNWIGIHITV